MSVAPGRLDHAARDLVGRKELRLILPPEVFELLVAEAAARAVATLEQHAKEHEPGWLDVHGAAGYLSVSEERIRKLVQRRSIPFSQEAPGCRIFFERQALDGWMRSQRGGA
jgi:excisionase family DNA binding protein